MHIFGEPHETLVSVAAPEVLSGAVRTFTTVHAVPFQRSEKPSLTAPGGSGTVTRTQVAPFHVSAAAALPELPTAMHADGPAHDTAAKAIPGTVPCSCQLEPSQRSAWPGPTAVHAAGELQETASS